jgi:protein-tyrosine kinase
MSRISKALEKYKKERNLTSTQIFNLNDSRGAESAPKESKEQAIPVDVSSAKESAQSHILKIESSAAAPRKAEQPAAELAHRKADEHKPIHKARIISLDKKDTQIAKNENKKESLGEEGEEADPVAWALEDCADASSEPGETIIHLKKVDENLVTVVNPQSLESKIFKVLRDKILFPKIGKPPQSILVTSAAKGEGKSFVASNLAISLSQYLDNHVLLLDCDMRGSNLNKAFGLGMVKGLSEHLENGNQLPELIIKTGFGRLSLLPSGKPPANPSDLLSSEKMANLIEELKNRYDDRFLVIDSPPLNIAQETAAIANLVHAVIVVINHGRTATSLIEKLLNNLGREKILGAVVNRYDCINLSGKTYRSSIINFNRSIINALKARNILHNRRN